MTNAERAVHTNTSTYGDLRRLPEGEKHDSEFWFKATGMRHGKRRTISWREGGALSGDPVLVHFVQALAHEKEGEPLETVAAEFPTTTINNHLTDADSALWIVRHTLDEVEGVEGEIPKPSTHEKHSSKVVAALSREAAKR